MNEIFLNDTKIIEIQSIVNYKIIFECNLKLLYCVRKRKYEITSSISINHVLKIYKNV